MRCPECRSTAVKERPECTAQGYRRFRCLDCTKQFNERSAGLLNRTQYPSDVIAPVIASIPFSPTIRLKPLSPAEAGLSSYKEAMP